MRSTPGERGGRGHGGGRNRTLQEQVAKKHSRWGNCTYLMDWGVGGGSRTSKEEGKHGRGALRACGHMRGTRIYYMVYYREVHTMCYCVEIVLRPGVVLVSGFGVTQRLHLASTEANEPTNLPQSCFFSPTTPRSLAASPKLGICTQAPSTPPLALISQCLYPGEGALHALCNLLPPPFALAASSTPAASRLCVTVRYSMECFLHLSLTPPDTANSAHIHVTNQITKRTDAACTGHVSFA